ncbi:MAG: insulinase family protein [Ignavibacteria bacterium]|nr:insulinase family protein [Ignavibacteria bacterium]
MKGNTNCLPKHSLKIEYTEHEIPNGLRIILSPNNSVPSIAINVSYHVGSKNEKINNKGYAHLFEHLMFEGSKNHAPGEYDRLALQRGCENNAYTTEDKTNYYLLVPENQLEFGLWLESDRMLEFSTTQESLEIQKGVVIEEKKQLFDNRPCGSASFEMAPLLFKNNGYAWDVIGKAKDIKNATLEDLRSFYNNYYTPNNAVLTLAGDFETEKAVELIYRYFGEIPSGNSEVKNHVFNDEPLIGETIKTIYDDIHLPEIFGAYKIPKENSNEMFAFDLLTDILSAGESSRLYRELVYKKQIVTEVSCWAEGRECAGILHFYAVLMPGVETEEVQFEIDRVINEIYTDGITEKEFTKVKNRTETRHIYKMQTNLSKADMFSHYKLLYNDPSMVNKIIERYNKVTIEDIMKAANEYINGKGRVILNYLPKEKVN